MRLSATAKVILGISGVLGLLLFVVIVDLGANAGQIHHGVSINHLNLGGLTGEEATGLLDRRGTEMSQTPIRFERSSVQCTFVPSEIGWAPKIHRVVAEALAVGRKGSLIHAATQRIKAWFGGIKIAWPDTPNRHRVAAALDDCQRMARSAGIDISRGRMRARIRAALSTWPRGTIPLQLAKS
jgi:hypothetical protein